MPFAKIHIRKGHGAQKKRAIANAVQASLVATLDIPEQDRFQLIEEYEDDHFIHTDAFLGLTYTCGLLMIEIAFTEGRSDELKKTLMADLNRRLVVTADVRPDDVVVLIYEFGAANVSLGHGLAQRAPQDHGCASSGRIAGAATRLVALACRGSASAYAHGRKAKDPPSRRRQAGDPQAASER
jgi:phenylpyruvate tautomerase PptA (4-oxalocrotonate tautomerase family)